MPHTPTAAQQTDPQNREERFQPLNFQIPAAHLRTCRGTPKCHKIADVASHCNKQAMLPSVHPCAAAYVSLNSEWL